jgi:hypothetical protein
MKGIVFVELLAMADHALGEDAVDGVIARCPLSSKGAYTAVGTYPSSELGQLVDGFSHWMLRRFAATFPVFFEVQQDAFTMLESIENEVHAEVRKLYPDAELPTFDTVREGDDTLVMTYRSPRRLIDFCHGLIEECLVHFGEQASITCTDLSTAEMGVAEFRIVRKAA